MLSAREGQPLVNGGAKGSARYNTCIAKEIPELCLSPGGRGEGEREKERAKWENLFNFISLYLHYKNILSISY